VIYYGSNFADTQGRLNTLVGNIKNHAAWGIVRNSYGGGSPYFANSVNVACDSWCTNSWSNCYPCNPTQWSESGILSTLFARGTVPKNSNALYIIVYGIDNTYTFSQSASQMCATHDIAQTDVGGAYLYRYISLPLIKSETSKCNFLKGIGYPNGNFRSDSGAAILFHEMVESVIPGYNDDWSYGVADKCANQVMGYGTTKSNVNVGGVNYLLPSIWDKNSQVCSLFVDEKDLKNANSAEFALKLNDGDTVQKHDHVGGVMNMNGRLSMGQKLYSANGRYYLLMQKDGQVCLYSVGDSNKSYWCGGIKETPFTGNSHYELIVQTDANLCISKDGINQWCQYTQQPYSDSNFHLVVQDDRNVCLYNHLGGGIWCSYSHTIDE
jgi:hypothetical protein